MNNIQVNEIEYCKLQVQYETDAENISKKKNEIVLKFKNRKVPGFRANKATPEAIKFHFKKEIDNAIMQELAQEAFENTLFEKNIKPFGQPKFSIINLEKDKFRCEFALFKQPDFELAKYKEFEIPKPAASTSVEDLSQRMLQELRTKNGKTTPYGENDFAQMNDNIILDYKTFLEGEPIEDLTSSGEILNIGRINIPGFSENLLGMMANETRRFDFLMPETYKQEYAGKTLSFEVKILSGSKSEPAALDDALAVSIGLENFDKLMESATSIATTRVKELEKNNISSQIINRIVEIHDFKIPEWISLGEAQINAKNAKLDWEVIPDSAKEDHIKNAEKSIKLSLVLQKVRENEPDAQLTDEEVFKIARDNLSKHSPNPDAVMEEVFRNGHIGILFNRIRDEHTIDFIEKTCTIVE